jgi:RNA polymerase sigma-70 factor, ECF subfamily
VSRFHVPAYTSRVNTVNGSTFWMVTPLTFVGGDDALIEALRAGHPGAVAVFYDNHSAHVMRTLESTLGADADLPDLLQEVFIRAIDRIGDLEDITRVNGWLTTIAVFTARAHIRRRARRKWLSLFSPERASSRQQEPPSSDARQALRQIYELMDRLPANERLAFVLRIIEGMTLPDAAEACQVSLATFKRRLSRAEKKFLEEARQRPGLVYWLEEGTRWSLGNKQT